MMSRGSERRRTFAGIYHSSDGPRNLEAKNALVSMKDYSSKKKLVTPVSSGKIEFQNNALGLKNTLELAPLSSTPSANISKRSNNSLVQKVDSPSKKGKLQVYVFKRKDDHTLSKNTIENPTSKAPSDESGEAIRDEKKKLTEENNKLIQQMMMDRTRQPSFTSKSG